jgi:hypothetical protein
MESECAHDQFYDRLVLKPEKESNFSLPEDELDACAGPPPFLGLYMME